MLPPSTVRMCNVLAHLRVRFVSFRLLLKGISGQKRAYAPTRRLFNMWSCPLHLSSPYHQMSAVKCATVGQMLSFFVFGRSGWSCVYGRLSQ